jgi:hypothetical protein
MNRLRALARSIRAIIFCKVSAPPTGYYIPPFHPCAEAQGIQGHKINDNGK